jgi:hypothetical protein
LPNESFKGRRDGRFELCRAAAPGAASTQANLFVQRVGNQALTTSAGDARKTTPFIDS